MIPPFLPVLLMATYEPNFNQIQAPQMTPQLNPGQVDLGISQVAAEFSRQESGLRANIQQMRENQAAMERSAKTQMNRTEMDWKNYMKLADFSSTLSDQLVENQEAENKKIMMDNMNQAFIDGADPHAQAKYDQEVAELAEGNKIAVGIATEYKNRGGLPDVAYEIERRSGWAAYGYAVGVAQNGGKNYGSFLEANKEREVAYRADGEGISLKSARNSAEYLAVQKVLRNEYMEPFAGLNPNLLNEYLIDPMRQEEDMAFTQWEKDFAENKEKERDLELMGSLADVKDNPFKAANLLEYNIQVEAERNGGNMRLARQTELARLTRLGERGMITPGEMQLILEQKVEMNGGKRRFIDTPEGKAALAAAETYQNQKFNREETMLRKGRQDLVRRTAKLVRDQGYLDEDTKAQFVNDYMALGGDPQEADSLFPDRDKAVSDAAAEDITDLLSAGAYVPEGLINQLDATKAELAREARRVNETRRVNMGLTEKNAKNLEKFIKREADKNAGTVGTTAESSAESIRAQRRALEWSQEWLAANRGRYDSESEMMEALENALVDEFSGKKKPGPNGTTLTGWDASQFNTAQVPDTKNRQAVFRENSETAQTHVAKLAMDGESNPYGIGAIPGTENELKKILAHVEKHGELPPRSATPLFVALADQAKGTVALETIIKEQLKSVYNVDFDLKYGDPVIDVLEGKDGVQLQEYQEIRSLLNVKPTPNTRLRAGADLVMMQNASEQGALSDPSDPNSPRIGQFVGGDGDLVAQGQGGNYTLEMTAVPGGYGPIVQSSADEFGIPVDILAALIEQESGYRNIPSQVPGSDAGGFAQFRPSTAAQFGINMWDPASSIRGAALYLRHLMDNYGFDLETAIYAYNAGPGTVLDYGIGASDENRKYYPEIMEKAKKYRRKSYGSVRQKYQAYVSDSPYNSPDALSPNLRRRIYQLA